MWLAVKAFLSTNWLKVVEWVGGIVGVLGIFFTIRKGGIDAERAKQLAQTVRDTQKATEVGNDIDRLGVDQQRQRLRDRWTRD